MAERASDVVILDERFWSKSAVDPTTPVVNGAHCRVWTARIDDNGKGRRFGRFWFDNRPVPAYQVACAEAEGLSMTEIRRKVVLHRCDNPLCVEQEHLRSGTQQENMIDMAQKGRGGGFLADPTRRYQRGR